MSLLVLQDIASQQTQNTLNVTNASLQKRIQQLSTGSKVNSGADDAAGLSMINLFEANQQALNQSQSNLVQGVGLLRVADGAISQVNSLLNRAVTLATEASNGTVSSSQSVAANLEYQSILGEINQIGEGTTFNQQRVFGSTTNILAGDSSASGEYIDQLSISALDSSSIGETDGAMYYTQAATSGPPVFTPQSNVDAGCSLYEDSGTSHDWLYLAGANGSSDDDTMTGTLALEVDGQTYTYTMGQSYNGVAVSSITTLAEAIQASSASSKIIADHANLPSNSQLSLWATDDAFTLTTNSLQDTNLEEPGGILSGISSNATLGGTLSIDLGSAGSINIKISAANHNNTAESLAEYINDVANDTNCTAAYNPDTQRLTIASSLASSPITADLSAFVVFSQSATLSYSADPGVDLQGSNLLTQFDAESALIKINTAITDAAAQDGYLGSQINILTAQENVMTSQSTSVAAAQNAIQATDYADTTSELSKYQILLQTGIMALGQENKLSQMVLKLLQ